MRGKMDIVFCKYAIEKEATQSPFVYCLIEVVQVNAGWASMKAKGL